MGNDGYLLHYPCHVALFLKGSSVISLLFLVARLVSDPYLNQRQVETDLMLEEKFRDLCEEVSNFVKEIEDVVKEVERLSCKDVAKETVCLIKRMLVYCDRENARDLEFTNGLDNLWVELLERTNKRQLFITELESLCPSAKRYKILECLNEDKKQDLIHLLEIRKVI
ncbi:hypothetical protein Tco_1351508 [Tanacetum coccineum]